MKRGIVVVEPTSADGTTISKATVRRRIGGLSEEEGWIPTLATRDGHAADAGAGDRITAAGLLRLVAPRDWRCDVMGSRRSVGGHLAM